MVSKLQSNGLDIWKHMLKTRPSGVRISCFCKSRGVL